MQRNVLLILMILGMTPLRAELSGVLRWDVTQDLEVTYRMIYRSLEESGFHVVFEPGSVRAPRGSRFPLRPLSDPRAGAVQGFCHHSEMNGI
jgi:hypothetical protein